MESRIEREEGVFNHDCKSDCQISAIVSIKCLKNKKKTVTRDVVNAVSRWKWILVAPAVKNANSIWIKCFE